MNPLPLKTPRPTVSSFILHPSSFPRQRAFTLIELLVVVSIIVLLIAILLPALSKAKTQSESTVCQTRLKALGTATHIYLAEFNGSFPINGLLFPKSGLPKVYDPAQTPGANPRYAAAEVKDPQKWRPEWGALWPYMNGVDVTSLAPHTPNNTPSTPFLPPIPTGIAKAYSCPTDFARGMPRSNAGTGPGTGPLTLQLQPGNISSVQVGAGQGGYWSYSINSVLNSLGRFRDNTQFANGNGGYTIPWNDPINLVSIKSQESFIWFLEEDDASLFNDEVMEPPTFRAQENGGNTERLSKRHILSGGGGGNVGFADSHVEWFNEIVFDNGSTQNAITHLFFPDGGEFLNGP